MIYVYHAYSTEKKSLTLGATNKKQHDLIYMGFLIVQWLSKVEKLEDALWGEIREYLGQDTMLFAFPFCL